jgi:arginase
VAIGDAYECHRCGSTFVAGLVRVPRAWGVGGEGMSEGARMPLPYPEVAIVERDTLEEQNEALAEALAARPIAVGGCCCTHVGAATGVSRRVDRLAVVWIDAHGDLNTPETSPSGNLWGMPFRMLLDQGVVAAEDAALVGARSLDPPEVEFMGANAIDDSLDRALAGVDATYVALDLDVLDPSEIDVLIPEPNGPSADELEALLQDLARRTAIAGIGVTGFLPTERNAALAARMLTAAGF